jgi:hypothetical protein
MHPMKKLILILTFAALALAVRAALPQPDLIAQIHFAGGRKIAAEKNYPAFANEFSSAEALALRKQTADKLAPWLAGWLQAKLGTAVPGGAAKLRPLFDDLQNAEWFLEARAAAGGSPEVALAIRQDECHAQLWQANWKALFPAAVSKSSGGWLVFDSSAGAGKLGDSLAQKISAPPAGWLSLDVNWPRLAQWYPALRQLGLPETAFEVTASETNLDIAGKFFFPENLSLKLDVWQFPSNSVHQPLVSFTAVRGFSQWLAGQDWAQPVKLSPPANQMFVWALNGVPFQTFAAVPVSDAGVAVRQLNAGLQPVIADRNAHDGFITTFTLACKNNQITLMGAPILAPYIKALQEPAGQFLLAGAFPNTPKSKPLPPELFQRLATKNLVYYHRETTSERMPSQLQMSQLGLMLTRHKQLEISTAAFKWSQKIGPTLGDTTTEITQTAPDQLAFSRKAPGGLTAFEFLALGSWLEATNFPHCDLKLPPLSDRMRHLRFRNQNTLAAPVPALPR